MEIHSTVSGPMFKDTGDWTLTPEPQSSVDRGSGSAHSLIIISSSSFPPKSYF